MADDKIPSADMLSSVPPSVLTSGFAQPPQVDMLASVPAAMLASIPPKVPAEMLASIPPANMLASIPPAAMLASVPPIFSTPPTFTPVLQATSGLYPEPTPGFNSVGPELTQTDSSVEESKPRSSLTSSMASSIASSAIREVGSALGNWTSAPEPAPATPAPTLSETTATPEPLATPESELRQRKIVPRVLTAEERGARLFRAAAEKLPPSLAKYAQIAEKIFLQAATILAVVLPFVTSFYGRLVSIYKRLPPHVDQMIFGLCVCLFGGHFAATLAVVEAFKQSGAGTKLWACVIDLYEAAQKVKKASDADDKKDDDGNGIPDVDEIPAGQLLIRKTTLALRNVDPIKFNTAMQGMYQGFIAAVVVVQFKFAKTVALGNSLGDFLNRSVGSHVAPVINKYVPADYQGWVKLVVAYLCKFIGISIAWTLQFYQSVVQSAINGSRIFSRALLKYLDPKPAAPATKPETKSTASTAGTDMPTFATPIIPIPTASAAYNATNMFQPPREDDSKIGEAIAWVMAFFGILFQYKLGFRIPFPISLVLVPLRMTESSLHWFASFMSFAGRAR